MKHKTARGTEPEAMPATPLTGLDEVLSTDLLKILLCLSGLVIVVAALYAFTHPFFKPEQRPKDPNQGSPTKLPRKGRGALLRKMKQAQARDAGGSETPTDAKGKDAGQGAVEQKQSGLSSERPAEKEDPCENMPEFTEYLQSHKVVALDHLEEKFGLSRAFVLKRIESLEQSDTVNGVFDGDRYIVITEEEYIAIALAVKEKGRVNLSELAGVCNSIIKHVPPTQEVTKEEIPT